MSNGYKEKTTVSCLLLSILDPIWLTSIDAQRQIQTLKKRTLLTIFYIIYLHEMNDFEMDVFAHSAKVPK